MKNHDYGNGYLDPDDDYGKDYDCDYEHDYGNAYLDPDAQIHNCWLQGQIAAHWG